MPMAPVLQLRPSQSEKPTVGGGRRPNAAFRSREYLTEPEIERLRKAARKNRNPVRDELLILLAFRHALRVSELVGLTVEQFDLKAATVHIRRAKNGTPGIHGPDVRPTPCWIASLVRAPLRGPVCAAMSIVSACAQAVASTLGSHACCSTSP